MEQIERRTDFIESVLSLDRRSNVVAVGTIPLEIVKAGLH